MNEPALIRRVGVKAERKLKGRRTQRDAARLVWSGLSMIGLVGWSVVLPTVLGAALGAWLDQRYPMSHSWTLTLLFAGLFVGCLNAWHWVAREDRETDEREKDHHE
ncbi:AtpZ/AtpI family protein [Nitrosovibrio tenuis]|uniref:ATP synthase protein I n=1 Tax=Nitrosovibrio tenuis TaxID=1233 RepID=A0A1H7I1S6_9PROT|nr:AtpZ/AtpI family protein [Nitrosovibrio tenuis]SEK56489.1 ATP synthase protein I [Nitrosovibrio tenuis]